MAGEAGEARGLQQDAGTERPRRIEPLEDAHVVAGAQKRRSGKPGGAGAHHGDTKGLHERAPLTRGGRPPR